MPQDQPALDTVHEQTLRCKWKELIVLTSPLYNTGLWSAFWGSGPARTSHHSRPRPPTAAAGGHPALLLHEPMWQQGSGHMTWLSFGGG